MKIYLHIIRPLLNWLQTKTNSTTPVKHHDVQRPSWILPTITYVFTLATGVWIGTLIQQPHIHRYQQLATTAQNREKVLLDSLSAITQLAVKDQQILTQNETILSLRQKLRADSIAHLTELQAIRAINAHLKKR